MKPQRKQNSAVVTGALVTLVGILIFLSRQDARVWQTQDELLTENSPRASGATYYGSHTLASCSTDSDCLISGCNAEICQGKNEEELFSICILPEQPTPQQLGYTCGCMSQLCQWKK